MFGRESAREGGSAVSSDGRITVVDSEGSNIVPMMTLLDVSLFKRRTGYFAKSRRVSMDVVVDSESW